MRPACSALGGQGGYLIAVRRPNAIAHANAKRSAVRSAVEHVFAGQKHRIGLMVRTIGIARARIKDGEPRL